MAVYIDVNKGNIEVNVEDIDAIKQSIINIVTTDVGSVPGFPEFGCNIRDMLFEQLSGFTISSMQTNIENALSRWEPRIYDVSADISSMPEFNKLICNISFTIEQLSIQENITFRLK